MDRSGHAPREVLAPDTDTSRKAELVTGSQLLVGAEVLDSFGHISVRSASEPRVFFMPRAMPPALVRLSDIIALSVDSGEPLDSASPRPNGERFIHSEIYKARPDVHCVIHSHSIAVLPFGVAGVALRPVIAQAGFLPSVTPVFEIREAWGTDAAQRGLQIRTREHAAAMALVLGSAACVLLRGHGHVVVGNGIRRAVVCAIYTNVNARVQMDAMALGGGRITPLDQKELEYNSVENFDVDRPWDNFVRVMEERASGRRGS
jgi:ribulose-5-phosphate 4-epimerase/fuculose-1-phosphate aldolase